jgi:hypothetical protein
MACRAIVAADGGHAQLDSACSADDGGLQGRSVRGRASGKSRAQLRATVIAT